MIWEVAMARKGYPAEFRRRALDLNASNRTARAMQSLAEHFRVAVAAYLPFYNRVPDAALDGLRVHALYEFASPRAPRVGSG